VIITEAFFNHRIPLNATSDEAKVLAKFDIYALRVVEDLGGAVSRISVLDLLKAGKYISAIKLIRTITGFGLRVVKDFFDLNRARWEA
jgi:ribosomal protein L7/L12